MTDQSLPPGWFRQPAIWSRWPSLRETFPPQLPSDPWNQANAQWWQQPDANGPATAAQSGDAWDRTTPAWLRSAMPTLPSGGILGSFPQPNDATDEAADSPDAGSGILASLDRWNPLSSNTGRGILAPLERLNIAANQATPPWLQPTVPANDDSLSKSITQPWGSQPAQPASQQGLTPQALYRFLFLPTAPVRAAQEDRAGTVTPPQQHLESGNYWGAGPMPGTSAQVPPNGFYLSRVPPTPSWDSVPTYPSGNPGQISQEQPDPTSWGAAAPGMHAAGDSPLDEAALAQQARDVAAARFARERRAAIERPAERQPDDRRGILTRMMDGAQAGAGGGELGISRENIQKYPALEMLQIPARVAETVPRAVGAGIGGATGLGAGLVELFGMSRTNADRLQRDLNVGGMLASLLAAAPRMRPGAPPPAGGSRASTTTMQHDAEVANGRPPGSWQREVDDAFRRAKQDDLQAREATGAPREPPPAVERSNKGPTTRRINSRGQYQLDFLADEHPWFESSRPPPELPRYVAKGKTTGVLRGPTGDMEFQSGYAGPASAMPKGSPGLDRYTKTHVEGHVAAFMRQQGITEATLYINNPAICEPCSRLLPRMLAPGSILNIVLPDGTVVPFKGRKS